MEWIKPVSHYDPSATWVTEEKAYDDDIETATSCSVAKKQWSGFLEFLIDNTYISKIRFWATYQGIGINKIDLDAYYDDTWNDVFEGDFLNKTWVEKDLLSIHFVKKIRVRFYNNNWLITKTAKLFEIELYETVGVPVLSTYDATDVEDTSATLNGEITHLGGSTVIERGFEYKEGEEGEVFTVKEEGIFEIGIYDLPLTGLTPDANYYFRTYAINDEDTGYGEWKSFSSDVGVPILTTSAATEVDHESALLHGEIILTNGDNAFERGFEYKEGVAGEVDKIYETGDFGLEVFEKVLDELKPNVLYYFRSYAKNSAGIGYGTWLSFTTYKISPTAETNEATGILQNQIQANGEITCTGGEANAERGFEYGLTKVATWTKKVTDGGYGAGEFYLTIDSLQANTEYWYRAYSKNTVDPFYGYGEWIKFITAAVGIIPLGRKNDICSDYSGYGYILNRSLKDDDETYESFFVLSTDLSGKKTLHTNKRLLDIWSYFDIREAGTCKIYIKQDNEPDWQEAGEVELTGEGEIIIKHLPVDYLAKHFLIKMVFQNDFKFIGLIAGFVPKGNR